MSKNRITNDDCRSVASMLSLPEEEVRKAVQSFFAEIAVLSRQLPFNNNTRIYRRDAFSQYAFARNIPYIGRIGPVYSRYLKWRRNVSKGIEQEARSRYRKRITQDDIEHMAEQILSGAALSPIVKRKGNELYTRVWLVDRNSKKLARQVIPKTKKKDVQD